MDKKCLPTPLIARGCVVDPAHVLMSKLRHRCLIDMSSLIIYSSLVIPFFPKVRGLGFGPSPESDRIKPALKLRWLGSDGIFDSLFANWLIRLGHLSLR